MSADLFHVAVSSSVPLILRHGLRTGLPPSEISGAVEEWMSRTGKDIVVDSYEFYDEMQNWSETGREDFAREKLNELLPHHDDAVFFYSSFDKAVEGKRNMEQHGYLKYSIVGVDSTKIPVECLVGDNLLADELFDEIVGFYDDLHTDEEEWDAGDEWERMAKRYVDGLYKWDGKEDWNAEVLCPSNVPKSAIVSIDGKPVPVAKGKTASKPYQSRGQGKGWHRESHRHSLSARGIKTGRRHR